MKIGIVILALSAHVAHGGPRTSPNYSIVTDATDAGGRRAVSASYSNDGSAGGIVGISTVASPAETAKHGYIGQLYEVTALQISAAPTTVNEGATRQLAAAQLLDDLTTIAVPAASVTWSILSGPLSVNTSGLSTAAPVYQNTAATAQGSYAGNLGSAVLTVLDSIPDNFGTYAGDGIGDDWQVQYFGQNNSLAAPGLDPDGDGQNNLFEFTAGLVPTDPGSLLRVRTELVPGQPGQKRIIFSPLILSGGRTYTVKFRADLAPGTWSTLTGSTQSDAGSERTVTDTTAAGTKRFYHVEINKP